MNTPALRNLIAHALIVVAGCVGAVVMLIKPGLVEIAQLEHELAEQSRATADAATQQRLEEAAASLSAVRERLADIEARNAFAANTSRSYSQIMDLADQRGVKVSSLQPGAPAKPSPQSNITVTRITMSASGEYERIAAFVDDVCHLSAFVRPVSAQMSPARGPEHSHVELMFACELASFALEDSLVQMGGSRHAQP